VIRKQLAVEAVCWNPTDSRGRPMGNLRVLQAREIRLLSEAGTRAKHIDPAIHARGWTEDLTRREETAFRDYGSRFRGEGFS